MMFGQFQVQKAALGAKVLKLNKDKGWLIPPPLHHYKAEDFSLFGNGTKEIEFIFWKGVSPPHLYITVVSNYKNGGYVDDE